jgi:uncharacterized protein (DUF362 family)
MKSRKTDPDGCNRREFIKKVGAGALAVGAAGCLPKVDGDWQTCEQHDGGVPQPASNRVVEVVSASVVEETEDTLTIAHPERVPEMLRTGLLGLTEKEDPADAWGVIFPNRQSGEVVGLKVNALLAADLKTSYVLVKALVDSLLQDAGIPAADILVWDRTFKELERADLTQEHLGVPCQGTLASASDKTGPGYETEAVCLSDQPIVLSTLLTRTVKHLINVPVLKSHSVSGFTGCLKNHYGSFSNPGDFHDNAEQHIARLNALPQIAEVNRLNIMDALLGVCDGDTDDPPDCGPGRLLFSFDPVAMDRRSQELRDEMRAKKDLEPGRPAAYLDVATELGVGAATFDLARVEVA